MSNLLTSDTTLIVQPRLAFQLGLTEAMLLQQLHYLMQRADTLVRGKRWVYNTIEQWQAMFPFLKSSAIRTAFTKLRKLGVVIVEKLARWKTNRTNFYTIDTQRLAEIMAADPAAITVHSTDASAKKPQMDVQPHRTSMCSQTADVYKDYPKTSDKEKTTHREKSKAKAPPIPAPPSQPQPTSPEPTPQQQTEAHPLIRSLWQHLRQCHIDIRLDDPALARWQTSGQARDIRQRALDLHLSNREVWWPAHAIAAAITSEKNKAARTAA